MSGFLEQVWANATSSDWWAANTLNYIIFGVAVAIFLWLIDLFRRVRYMKWRLKVIGYDDRELSLYWDEVQRFLNSRFELWKFVKSVVSGTLIVRLRNAEAALEEGWVNIDERSRRIVVDITKIPPEHVVRWDSPPPLGALAGHMYKPRDVAPPSAGRLYSAGPMTAWFVSRHPGAVEWARRHGIEAVAIDHLDVDRVAPGDTVIGTLPLHLAAAVQAKGARFLFLELDLPPEARGHELDADAMERYGGRLVEYRIERIGETL